MSKGGTVPTRNNAFTKLGNRRKARPADGLSICLGNCDACYGPLYTPVRLIPLPSKDQTEMKRNRLVCGGPLGCKTKR